MSMEVIVMKGIWEKLINKRIYYVSLFDGMLVKKSNLKEVLNIIGIQLIGMSSCIRFKDKVI